MTSLKVTYIHSRDLTRVADQLPSNVGRASLVHNLISNYGLLDDNSTGATENGGEQRARVLEPVEATREELCAFHDEEFIGKFISHSLPLLHFKLIHSLYPLR